MSSLGVDEFYRVSHCETVKAMWDVLQVAHEGTNEVKQARVNTLNQEFKLFRMKHGETIAQMQKRFSHLINRLNLLGNPISNGIPTNKVLRCLTRNWQPKVTAIKEANNLTTLDLTTLFGKLEEHEQELNYLGKHERTLRKRRKRRKTPKKRKERSLKLLGLQALIPQGKSTLMIVFLVMKKIWMMGKWDYL